MKRTADSREEEEEEEEPRRRMTRSLKGLDNGH
jgi:hypothetical protein